jgi:hypothetical protein
VGVSQHGRESQNLHNFLAVTYPKEIQQTIFSVRIGSSFSRQRGKGIGLKVTVSCIQQHDPGMWDVLQGPNPVEFISRGGNRPSLARIGYGGNFKGLLSAPQIVKLTHSHASLGRVSLFPFGVETGELNGVRDNAWLRKRVLWIWVCSSNAGCVS